MGGVIDASLLMIVVGGDFFVDLSLLLSLALLIGRVAGDDVVVVGDGGDGADDGAGAGAGDSFVIGVFVVDDVVIVVVGSSTKTGDGDDSFVSDAFGLVDGGVVVVVADDGAGDGDGVFDDVTVISA